MAQFADFIVDSNGDLEIQNGDFVVGLSDFQHIQDIIYSFAGEWKQFPLVGVGIQQYLKSQNASDAVNSIKQQLQSDGYSLSTAKVENVQDTLKVSFPNGITRNG